MERRGHASSGDLADAGPSTNTVSLYVYDGLGNPTAILRDFGSPGYTYTYDPFGLPTLTYNSGGTGQTQNPFLFKGGIQDRATGWVHFGNRWYNTTLGRWTQQDTLDAPLDPGNANRYAYAGADPSNNVDPTGLLSASCVFNLIDLFGSLAGAVSSLASLVGASATGIGLAAGGLLTVSILINSYNAASAFGSSLRSCR